MAYRPNAHDREGFKNRLLEHLGGALLEFYKSRLAQKNGETRWVLHWMREAIDLIDRAVAVFTTDPIRGFKNKQLAFEEVWKHLEKKDRSYRRIATNTVRSDFAGKRFRSALTDQDTEEFWKIVVTTAKNAR